jgi:hypothetical protein
VLLGQRSKRFAVGAQRPLMLKNARGLTCATLRKRISAI